MWALLTLLAVRPTLYQAVGGERAAGIRPYLQVVNVESGQIVKPDKPLPCPLAKPLGQRISAYLTHASY